MTSPTLKNGSTVVRLVISFRKDGKVKNRIVKVIGQSKDKDIIEQYKKTARSLIEQHKKGLICFAKTPEKHPIDLYSFLGHDRYNNGFEDILGDSYEKLGFHQLIKTGKSQKLLNQALRDMVLMRVFSPSSKLRSCYLLEEHFNRKLSHKRVLNMMDHISKREIEIKKEMFESLLGGRQEMDLMLFDVTTLYFESVSSDELRDFGYSKDGKFNEVQLVLAVLSDKEGMPLSYEVFSGGTGETKTLSVVLGSFVRSHKVKRIKVVADRGMFSDNNFSFFEGLEKELGIKAEYVVSSPLKKMSKEIKLKILDFKKKCHQEKLKFYEFSYKGRRIVVSYSEELRKRDERKRNKILEKLSGLGKEGKVASSRLIKNTGVRRYLKKIKGVVEIDEDKIVQEALWDGLYGVCSNRKEGAKQVLESYRCLWKIEELFRINKHTLKMRPIYHRLSKRIKAHILIGFLAYAVLRRTEILLKKAGLSFSPQELIDILKNTESFIIQDKVKGSTLAYCIPRALSKPAQKIYAVFNKDYPKRPYKLDFRKE